MCIFLVHVMPAITCYLENWTKSEKNVRNEIMLLIQELLTRPRPNVTYKLVMLSHQRVRVTTPPIEAFKLKIHQSKLLTRPMLVLLQQSRLQ
jgi:hypothetical protein